MIYPGLIRRHAGPRFRFRRPMAQQVMETPRMAYKLALLAVAFFLAWMFLFRSARGTINPKREPPPPSEALEPCPQCGVYRVPGGACGCDSRSTSQD